MIDFFKKQIWPALAGLMLVGGLQAQDEKAPEIDVEAVAKVEAESDAVGDEEPHSSPTTGMLGTIDQIIIPGTELEPKPLPDEISPMVLRIVQTYPHGDYMRYDISFFGRIPGRYDLRDYLQRKDGSGMDDVQAIPVSVVPMRPLGDLVRPDVELKKTPRVGGYTLLMFLIGALWVIGLLVMIFGFRKKSPEQQTQFVQPVTLADQLRPLVTQAQSGELSKDGQASLERTLLKVWRKRLGLENADSADAIIQLRKHEEAGGLLRELEKWLHKPGESEEVDVAELLKPYEKLPAEG